MFSKSIPFILLLIFLIQTVITQGVPSQGASQNPQNPQNPPPPPPQGKPGRKHPSDTPYYDMERKGKKPKDVNLKFDAANIPDINVDVVEVNDYDEQIDVITNRSKLKIKWSINSNNNKNNKNNGLNNNNNNNVNPVMGNNVKKFTLKLLGNVTQDSETKLFYSINEKEIQKDITEYEFEYKIPKLEEDYVYNVAVIAEPDGISKNNSIGISKTFVYKYMEKTKSVKEENKENNKGGKNPVIYIIIGAGCLALLALAFLISKKIAKNDNREEDDVLNLPIQSRDSLDFKGKGTVDKSLDRISVVTDDTGEVSWTNLEVAQTSNQTKNEANDHFIRTLDKTYKTLERKKHSSIKSLEENQSYKVVRLFIPSEEDEIKLNIGDDVEITEIFEDGWCEGKNVSSGEEGVFPRTCVVEADQYATMIERSKSTTLPSRRRSKRNSYSNNNNYYYNTNNYVNTTGIIPE